jgi:pyruvate dehydrogenase E2 component (dihydrolipoamide acetyltransferase)
MLKDVKIPEISENVTSGTIVEVHVKAGDAVAVDDVLVEMETEKAVVEIPSPYAGTIEEVLVAEGDEKNVGDVIVKIDAADEEQEEEGEPREAPSAEAGEKEDQAQSEPAQEEPEASSESEEAGSADTEEAEEREDYREAETEEQPAPPPAADREAADRSSKPERPAPAAPSVRRFARELGVDIHAVAGSGHDGRISQADISAHVKQRLAGQAPDARKADAGPSDQPPLPDFSRWGPVRSEKLATVRRLTAENTSASWRIVPQVTQFDEADITDLQTFLERHGKQAERQGGKLTVTAVLMKVCAAALERFPAFNASIDLANEQLIYKDYVHIGLAVDTDRGLLVPVIRDVQTKGILALAAEIVDTAQRARNKKTKPDEFEGGTFTISNQGGIGGTAFTPVVVWPQAAILGISRAQPRLVEVDGEIASRTILPLCVSYDHRIVDGADAARFLDFICRSLEQGLTLVL